MRKLVLLAVAALLAMTGTSRIAAAQGVDVIRGQVIGPDNLPMSNATVTATSVNGGVNRTARTDGDGRYTIIFPGGEGDYFMSVTAIGYAPLSDGFWPWLSHLILPAIAIGTTFAAIIARMIRSSMLEVLKTEYMQVARAKGLLTPRLIFVHALPNALIPVVYDTPRTIRVIGEDDAVRLLRVNDPNFQPSDLVKENIDLSKGRYDVAISTGPA